jgi:uncharacterized protein (TIGR03437 family)
MCQKATIRVWGGPAGCLLGVLALGGTAWAQPASRPAAGIRLDWRRIGNSAIELSLASPASGPIERVWYSPDGSRLFARTRAGQVLESGDFEKWQPSSASPPPGGDDAVVSPNSLPEGTRAVRANPASSRRLYAYGGQVYRSDDGGLSWANLTAYRRESIIGGGMTDLAVSPRDPDEVVVGNEFGVWRSLDGGASWTGLNDSLPNLPARRLLGLPQGSRGVRVVADGLGAMEWAPGEKQTWRLMPEPQVAQEAAARRSLSQVLGADITALAMAGDLMYAGSSDGRLWVSLDKGQTWRPPWPAEGGPVNRLYVNFGDPRLALAASGSRVLRTINAGLFWDDLTADLPSASVHAVTADRPTGTIYIATDRGVFETRTDLTAAGPATNWTRVGGNLPPAPALDARLDAEGNQLFVVLEGYGVYAALAPHRMGSLRWVNAADFSQRPAAPGSLLSVLGGRIENARAGDLSFPVLAASEAESQIQVPFEARGQSLALALQAGTGSVLLGLPLQTVSPAIFIDRDGTPLLLDADSGLLLDAMNPAHSNSRVQILATGLGRVRPDWPTGLRAPSENPPQVIAAVRAYLDRTPLEVTRAVLAAGYIGLYLVEVQLPALVNAGPAEVFIETDGQQSNRVRVYIEP